MRKISSSRLNLHPEKKKMYIQTRSSVIVFTAILMALPIILGIQAALVKPRGPATWTQQLWTIKWGVLHLNGSPATANRKEGVGH